jgi:hypothetical protein
MSPVGLPTWAPLPPSQPSSPCDYATVCLSSCRVAVGRCLPLALMGYRPGVSFAREMLWQPHGRGRIVNGVPPVDYLVPAGPGQLALDEHG